MKDMMNHRIEGFTLIEVLTVILLTGLLTIMLTNLFSFLYKYWVSLQNNIDIRHQVRVLSSYLEKDIKKATRAKVMDIENDGDVELLLAFGPAGSGKVDDYIQYNVKDKKLAKKIPTDNGLDSDDNITLISDDLWPLAWGNNSFITLDSTEVLDFNSTENFSFFKFADQQVYFKFKLKQQDQYRIISNIIHPRNLSY